MQDKIETDPFPFLGLVEKEILKRLALLDGLSEGEELNWLIRARARSYGTIQGILDERHAQLSQQGVLVVQSLGIRRETEDADKPAGKGPGPVSVGPSKSTDPSPDRPPKK